MIPMLIIWVSTAVSVRYQMYFFTILKLLIVLFIANGVKTIQAIVHRQKANPIGGMCPLCHWQLPYLLTKERWLIGQTKPL